MKHYGDITKLNGADLPIVDVITGGSPCQDLSVAGSRAGLLGGERSVLFLEQIRIIKEMREHDRQLQLREPDGHLRLRPRYMVFENVPGLLSSGTPKGEDFRIVLEETARIVQPDAVIPRPAKWSHSGCIMGDGWSIAYTVHDAQYWGVPQRRKRLALVADFNGYTAPTIIFNPQLRGETDGGHDNEAVGYPGAGGRREVQTQQESMRGDSEESGEEGQATPRHSEGSPGSATLKIRGGARDRLIR